MEKNLEILDRLYNLRYRSGKVHLFHSINKLVERFGNVVSLDKIYVSKEYLSYLSEKLFKDKDKLISFFGGNNKFVRLSLVHEFMQDFKENENEDITKEDIDLIQRYLTNWKNLQDKIRYFIPEEFYNKKNNYFYTCLLSYIKFFEKLNSDYESGMKYLLAIN